ncbi:MAG TPA: hypothetical protein VFR31_08960, partial [Thermoanaerobaculia bacterium]|nr:hypothetical protein [Thermoanaerobaculia bacterium]
MRRQGEICALRLDRPTVAGLAAGLVMLQALIFSAGFLLGAADGVQALTPPEPPIPVSKENEEIQLASVVRRQPEAVFPGSAGVPPATNQ